jgi:glucose/arabinose dehydrogenase
MKTFTLVGTFLCLVLLSKAQFNRLPKLELAPFATGFQYPIDLAHGNDSRLFVAERLGKIWIIDADGNKIGSTPYLDITARVFTVFPEGYDERGLLGIAMHPNYPDSPYVYVNYTGLDSNSYVSRFTTDPNDPNKALQNSEVIMLKVNQPNAEKFVNHKAGCLKFGADGYLYGTFGDGGYFGDPRNNAQDLKTLLGKMFRIDVNKPDMQRGKNYSIPASNPYAGMDKVKQEIWASGLRNPFRFSFDKLNGDLWLPDVGQDKWEEINYQKAGANGGRNYGWSCYEADHNYKIDNCAYNGEPYTFPIVEYKHSSNNCASITGGFVYRGSKYPKMYGMYIYNDYCTGRYSVVFKQNQSWVNLFLLDEEDGEYTGFGEDVNGELYAIDQTTGEIERVVDESEQSGEKNNAPALASVDVKLTPNPNNGQFTVELTTSKQGKYSVIVTDINGSTILSENKLANAGVNRWNFVSSRFRTGTYMLHVQSASTNISKTFVVEK